MDIKEWVHNLKSNKPYTTIIKALLGSPISMETVIGGTTFNVLKSDA